MYICICASASRNSEVLVINCIDIKHLYYHFCLYVLFKLGEKKAGSGRTLTRLKLKQTSP